MACEVKAATITLQCQAEANQCLMALYDLYTDVGNLGVQLYGWRRAEYGRKRRTAVASHTPALSDHYIPNPT